MFVRSESYTKELQAAFAGETVEIFAYGELDSTNTEAKRLAAAAVCEGEAKRPCGICGMKCPTALAWK